MKIHIDKTDGKISMVEATYETWLNFDVGELDIDWTKVEMIWCRYGTLRIKMEDETIIELEPTTEGESDYKWPVQMKLLDADYNTLWEEN